MIAVLPSQNAQTTASRKKLVWVIRMSLGVFNILSQRTNNQEVLGTCADCANEVVVMDPSDLTICTSDKDFDSNLINLSQHVMSVYSLLYLCRDRSRFPSSQIKVTWPPEAFLEEQSSI